MLSEEFNKGYFNELENLLAKEYKDGKEIFPPRDLIFNAFNLTPLDKVFWEFVCVAVLRPSQPNGVMSSAVSLPNHTFTGQA